ncbi:hypothetical protein CTI12_AA542880 [Artemisia annua]|uniref:Uncharacterized protein n=1 Tax=Artemisia annua TaxID=35608 RepID=A0A2U1L0F2_ARTAN|nr:hypothetical protein CTI12_AA542880 [Artemisia annua]
MANCFGTIPTLGSGQVESLGKQKMTKSAILNSQKGKNVDKVKSKGKKVIEQEHEDNDCPWILYINKSGPGKWVVRTFKD